MGKSASWLIFTVLSLAMGGCVASSGPSGEAVLSSESPTVHYNLVRLDETSVQILAETEPQGLAGAFVDKRAPANIVFGIGDVVSVTIFEAAAGGLFIPSEAGVRPGNYVTIPDQIVDNQGFISVPYAGLIKAAGRTNVQIQRAIVDAIKNRAIEPQVVVTLSQQRASLISVEGEVNTPVRYAAAAAGAEDKVTDAITRAGGIRGQGYETWVTLERSGRRATVPFENLVMHPSNNIFVRPGDRIYVYREPQQFIAFGAAGQQGEFPFNAWRINLAEAIAKAGGLIDAQANPGTVFLYRREPRQVAEKLGVDVSKFEGDTIPVIFSVSFLDPGGYFLATKVVMRNQDVVFAANAPAVQVEKFLTLVNLAIAPVTNGAYTAALLK